MIASIKCFRLFGLSARFNNASYLKFPDSMAMSCCSSTASLFVLFGLPTWALVDGTWASLSQLAENVPEGYSISSYLMVALTLGNFFPIVIGGLFQLLFTKELLPVMIFSILLTGLSAGVLLSIFWDYSMTLGGSSISAPLFVLFFAAGSCAALSNVSHYTFVSKWPPEQTTWLATGMGVGSMLTGLLALTQGLAPNDSSFTVQVYYLLLASFYLPSLVSFRRLSQSTPVQQSSHTQPLHTVEVDARKSLTEHNGFNGIQRHHQESEPMLESKHQLQDLSFIKEHLDLLLVQLIISSLGYGLVPSIISTFCGKFANRQLALLLSTSIGAVVDPGFRALTNFFRITSVCGFYSSLAVLVALGVLMAAFTSLPPSSPLFGANYTFLPVMMYIVFNGLNAFTSTSLFRYFKEHQRPHRVQQSYRLLGVASQTGALLGTSVTFAVIFAGLL